MLLALRAFCKKQLLKNDFFFSGAKHRSPLYGCSLVFVFLSPWCPAPSQYSPAPVAVLCSVVRKVSLSLICPEIKTQIGLLVIYLQLALLCQRRVKLALFWVWAQVLCCGEAIDFETRRLPVLLQVALIFLHVSARFQSAANGELLTLGPLYCWITEALVGPPCGKGWILIAVL